MRCRRLIGSDRKITRKRDGPYVFERPLPFGIRRKAHGSIARCGASSILAAYLLPPFAAWAALLMSTKAGLLMLAAAIAAMLWVDVHATRAGEVPSLISQVAFAAFLLGKGLAPALPVGMIAPARERSDDATRRSIRGSGGRVFGFYKV